MEDISSEQELLELRRDGKITEDEYKQLLDAMRKSPPSDSQNQNNAARKYMPWFSLAIIIIIAAAILLPKAASLMVKEHQYLTISRAYWFHSDERPSSIPSDAVPMDDEGHMLFHVDEWFEEMGTAKQYRPFLNKADNRFVLKANGHPDVQANAERGCWSQEFYVRIPGKEYVKMKAGVPYTIEPMNSNTKYKWKVATGVTICKLNE